VFLEVKTATETVGCGDGWYVAWNRKLHGIENDCRYIKAKLHSSTAKKYVTAQIIRPSIAPSVFTGVIIPA
jgi:hypothetical protein